MISKISVEIMNTGLTAWLIYMSYFEAGIYTAIILVLISINIKLQSYFNAVSVNNMKGVSDLLGKIVDSKF